jgi:hypothetical protein
LIRLSEENIYRLLFPTPIPSSLRHHDSFVTLNHVDWPARRPNIINQPSLVSDLFLLKGFKRRNGQRALDVLPLETWRAA